MQPAPAADTYPLAEGVLALPGGFALLTAARALVCADAHLGYEDVMGGGGALPLWSTTEIVASIALAARRHDVREIVFLGDAIHGAGLSEGAARAVRARARRAARAGRGDGRRGQPRGPLARRRGARRDGRGAAPATAGRWSTATGPSRARRARMIGHLHPSLHLGGDRSAPAFLAAAGAGRACPR